MGPHSKSSAGCLRSTGTRGLGCLVLLFLAAVAWLGFDTLEAPWASPFLGRSTLTGQWMGTFTSPSGTHFALYLDLQRTGSSGEYSGDLLDGHGYWCDDKGRTVENNPISGTVPMFSGYAGSVDNITVHIEPAKTDPQGLYPVNLSGKWTLDTLTFMPELSIWTGNSLMSSSNDINRTQPFTVTMKKADLNAYHAACAKLGQE